MSFDYSVFDTLLEPLFIVAEDHKIIYANETALLMCGLTLRKLQKIRFDEALSFGNRIEWLENLTSVTDATAYKELSFKNTEGQEGRGQITCRPFTASAPDQHWIIYVRDVTLEERLQKKYRGELEQKEGYIEELKKAQAELEKYSKNLEKMVEARTHEITRLNQQMKALLDSLHQGFLIFGRDGQCFEVSSKACETVLESSPSGKAIWDVLRMPAGKVEGFKKWMLTMFEEMLPFEDLAPLGPPEFPHSAGKTVAIEYFPLRSDAGRIDGVVVVASDITSLVEARKQAAEEREHASLIIKLVKNRKEISRFIRESQDMLRDLKLHLKRTTSHWDREQLYRTLHTVKGGSASFSVMKTAELCHQAEQIIAEAPGEALHARAQDLKSKCEAIDQAFTQFVSETRNILGDKGLSEERSIEIPVSEIMHISRRISHWSKGQELADQLIKTYIMEPIGSYFEPYKELVQSVAQQEEKKVRELEVHNAELKILPEIYSSLLACLVHAFRNGVDHGIEKPEVRRERGKPEAGSIEVFLDIVKKDSDILRIRVVDDGAGIHPEKIREKLRHKGITTQYLSDHEVIQHVFNSEFSTKDVVTETSGRGVGMDAILIAALQLGGQAWVDSVVGEGTTLTIEVPYLLEAPSQRTKLNSAA
jgi:two-component system chemotaxis sensor kinase CheA